MRRHSVRGLVRAWILWAVVFGGSGSAMAQEAEEWRPVGLLRVRDLSLFGILRLDMLPAHAVSAPPGTWSVEANLAYQNTFAFSANVRRYLKSRGTARAGLSQQDVDAILHLPDDAYYIDSELGMLDVGFHYSLSPHWEANLTVPVLHYGGGFLDSSIESFHDAAGFSNRDRVLVARNSSQFVLRVGNTRLGVTEPPQSNGLGDPVLGARWVLWPRPSRWNLVLEGAAKLPVDGERPFLSDGKADFGAQATLQRFFRHQALYLEVSEVYGGGIGGEPNPRYNLITTLNAGWEFKLTGRTNAILQLYAGQSGIQNTTLQELKDDKYQTSLGIQTWRGNTIYRFALTENIAHHDNTPDFVILLSAAHAFTRQHLASSGAP